MVLKAIQQFFDTRIHAASGSARPGAAGPTTSEHGLQLATSALLIEMTRADFKVEEAERRMVGEAIRRTFNLSDEETEELIRLADEESRQSASIYDFTRLIDRGFSLAEKTQVVELLWRVALSDAELEKHEEHLIRKIAKLIHVPHSDFIDAKLKAQESLKRRAAGAGRRPNPSPRKQPPR